MPYLDALVSSASSSVVGELQKPVALFSVNDDGVTVDDIANSMVYENETGISVEPAMDWKLHGVRKQKREMPMLSFRPLRLCARARVRRILRLLRRVNPT